jgi:hypothetical protein
MTFDEADESYKIKIEDTLSIIDYDIRFNYDCKTIFDKYIRPITNCF